MVIGFGVVFSDLIPLARKTKAKINGTIQSKMSPAEHKKLVLK